MGDNIENVFKCCCLFGYAIIKKQFRVIYLLDYDRMWYNQ